MHRVRAALADDAQLVALQAEGVSVKGFCGATIAPVFGPGRVAGEGERLGIEMLVHQLDGFRGGDGPRVREPCQQDGEAEAWSKWPWVR